MPKLSKRHGATTIMKHPRHLIHKVVTGCSVGVPVSRQSFACPEDFLDHDVRARAKHRRALRHQLIKSHSQFAAVIARIGQTIDMIDTHAIDQTLCIELKDFLMRRFKDLIVFRAKRGELVDIEEPPPVDGVIRDLPPGEMIILLFKQAPQTLPPGSVPPSKCAIDLSVISS